jgi:hypothetical protein
MVQLPTGARDLPLFEAYTPAKRPIQHPTSMPTGRVLSGGKAVNQ